MQFNREEGVFMNPYLMTYAAIMQVKKTAEKYYSINNTKKNDSHKK